MRKARIAQCLILVPSAFLLLGGILAADTPGQTKIAKHSNAVKRMARRIPLVDDELAKQHPLWPALELAVNSYKHIRGDIKDYTCTVARRERVDGVLQPHEYMLARVRHRRTRGGTQVIPFSVYLKFLGPTNVKGREVLYVDGQNDGKMFVRNGGQRLAFVKTRLDPTSDLAMQGNRYPVTEFGFENLVWRLLEVAKEDIAMGAASKVEFFRGAKVDGAGLHRSSRHSPDVRPTTPLPYRHRLHGQRTANPDSLRGI